MPIKSTKALENAQSVFLSPPDTGRFSFAKIVSTNWCKSFPYQLMIFNIATNLSEDQFTLPIGPESFSISTPFAINMSVTQDAIVEQHNGAPIRNITMSGTTGVMPFRGEAGKFSQNSIESMFGGTIQAARNTVQSGIDVANSLTGARRENPNIVTVEDGGVFGEDKLTGYYQFHLLRIFLEKYVELRRSEDGAKLRLVLLIHKDDAAYFVTPVSFDLQRSASSPLEYRFSLSFRAWKRVSPSALNATLKANETVLSKTSTDVFSNVKNTIDAARRTIKGAQKTLRAAKGDISNILLSIRQASLITTDVAGLTKTLADFPAAVEQSFKEELERNIDIIRSACDDVISAPAVKSWFSNVDKALEKKKQGISDWAKSITPMPDEVQSRTSISLVTKPRTLQLINDELTRVRAIDRAWYDARRTEFLNLEADLADMYGMGNATWDTVLDRVSIPKVRDPSYEDIALLYSISEMAENFARLAAYEQTPNQGIDVLNYVAGLSAQSGIDFRVPKSKFAIPFPYNHTLEQISALYLGDPNRWMEIATLNDLRAPYIDEAGFTRPFLTAGIGNKAPVSSVQDLALGQIVTLTSTSLAAAPENRKLIDITKVNASYYMLTFDGEANIDAWDGFKAYLPNTVNSQKLLYIPSNKPAPEEPNTLPVPSVSDLDAMLDKGGIDLLLTDSGDLAITPEGDCRIAYGIANIIQRIRVAFSTPKGSMLLHPGFGLGIEPGTSLADISAQDLLATARAMFEDDPTFASVRSASVRIDGPTVTFSFEVLVAGSDTVLPIRFNLQTP